MRCDKATLNLLSSLVTVSIPAGFSDALRRWSRVDNCALTLVSIPAGFSDALRLRFDVYVLHRAQFQSLLGFLMRCDSAL